MQIDDVKFNGRYDEKPTGAKREVKEGRGQPSRVSPVFLQALMQRIEGGKKVYGDRNWEKGVPFSEMIDSIGRHQIEIMKGDTSEDHAAAIGFWAMALRHGQEMVKLGVWPASMDDIPRFPTTGPQRIYVSGPYSAPTEALRLQNQQRAEQFAQALMRKGHLVHCPHAATAFYSGFDYERFMELDFCYLDHWATAIFQYQESPGANRELALAKANGLTIYTKLEEVPECPLDGRFPLAH